MWVWTDIVVSKEKKVKNYWDRLQEFYAQVFDWKFDPSKFKLPDERAGFVWLVLPETLVRQQMYDVIARHFSTTPSASWLSLSGTATRAILSQSRPPGTYFFAYRDSQTPDAAYLGMSQEDAGAKDLLWMRVDEYLLATSFRKFLYGEFLDLYSETWLAENWFLSNIDSGMVYGFYQHRGRNPQGYDPEGYEGVCLFNGPPKLRIKTAGPREITLLG